MRARSEAHMVRIGLSPNGRPRRAKRSPAGRRASPRSRPGHHQVPAARRRASILIGGKDPGICLDRHPAALAGLQRDPFPPGKPVRAPRRGDIELRNIGSLALADVGHGKADRKLLAARHSEILMLELGVAQAKPEREKRFGARPFEPAISDIAAFMIIDREWRGRGRRRGSPSDHIRRAWRAAAGRPTAADRQPARWRYPAEDRGDRLAAALSRIPGLQNGA